MQQDMDIAELSSLMAYIRQHNVTGAHLVKPRTPRIRRIVPCVDAHTLRVCKIELFHGHKMSRKNFEVKYTPSNQTLYQHIMTWLDTEVLVGLARETAPVVHQPMTYMSKINTPADPFYHAS